MKFRISISHAAWVVSAAVLFMVASVGILAATSSGPDAETFQACVDQHGNVRILGEELVGKFATQCKDNEVPYEFASSQSVDQLQL